jgi:eukaryotic-like serine/threonine-protein kinase
MSGNRQRTVWQVVGLYLASSWLCLQVVDLLADRVPLPTWAFPLTLALLAVGLPVVAATAFVQGFVMQRVAGSHPLTLRHRLLTWSNVLRGGVGAMAVWGVAVSGWLVLTGGHQSEWDVVAGVAEIERLAGEAKHDEAYALAERLDRRIRNDSIRDAMWALVSVTATIESTPTGARVFMRSYAPAGAGWEELGRTPVTAERVPLGLRRLRLELAGYRTRELAAPATALPDLDAVTLYPESDVPAGMAYIAGAGSSSAYGLFAPGLEQVAAVAFPGFLMSLHEVTNREYQEFVDAGGYTSRTCWEHPFVHEGSTLAFEEATARFRDPTGRPGPATWDAGTYRRGTADHPVGGVSWYEAAAYACWKGMSLPTVYHWYRAAGPASSPHVVPLSNFGESPAPVGSFEGVSRDGIRDLAGNVREWTRNAHGEARFILGGSWADQVYAFNDAVTAPAFDRSPMNGIRLVHYPDTTNLAAASAPLELAFRDYRAERAVADDVFAAYRQMYVYDDVPLNARIVATDTAELWIRQRIEMDAGYGGERLTTFLFLPRGRPGPHQAVVLFPGSGDIYRRSYDELSIEVIDFLLRSGRALIYPTYKGTFERGTGLRSDIQDMSNEWRDHVIAWSKDLRRSVDYVATRDDIALDELSYVGISWGGAVAPIMLATGERRLQVARVAALSAVAEARAAARFTSPPASTSSS